MKGAERFTVHTGRQGGRERAEGKNRVKTGSFEARDLVLLLLTLTFEWWGQAIKKILNVKSSTGTTQPLHFFSLHAASKLNNSVMDQKVTALEVWSKSHLNNFLIKETFCLYLKQKACEMVKNVGVTVTHAVAHWSGQTPVNRPRKYQVDQGSHFWHSHV